MDYSQQYFGGVPGGGDADTFGGFFIFGDQKIAFNAMDAGNWMWGKAMNVLGFDYSTAQFGSEANEKFKDASGDQRAIRSGFHFKLTTTKASSGFTVTNGY
jgi:hypothetical protein